MSPGIESGLERDFSMGLRVALAMIYITLQNMALKNFSYSHSTFNFEIAVAERELCDVHDLRVRYKRYCKSSASNRNY